MADPSHSSSQQRTSDHQSSQSWTQASDVLVISGGSGYNDLVGATPGATFVMPVSDNGGSSSEIIRVLGGPSIGDLRSRLNRLIPLPSRPGNDHSFDSYSPPPSNEAIYNLLSYRLPSKGKSREIKQEWMDILEGRHHLWRGIEPERKEVIRGFLVHFESEVLRRAHRQFNFRGGSIGNFFLAAAQKFFRSIQSAIFLFSATTQINASQTGSKVLPVINTNHTATIAAVLEDGEIIVGQCEISHPAPKVGSHLGSGLTGGTMLPDDTPDTQPSNPPALFPQHRSQPFSDLAQDPALLTPGFGPPAHYSGQGLGTSYEAARTTEWPPQAQSLTPVSPGDVSPAGIKVGRQKFTAGPSPLFARLVEEKAAGITGTRQTRTTVGNYKDGLDPEEGDQDWQDGLDDADPLDATAEAKIGDDEAHERTGNIVFQKQDGNEGGEESLPSKISRICYVNAYRNEIYPAPNPAFTSSLLHSKTLIYSCGSLWTSIVPCLCLRGIATSIATSPTLRHKILLLNTVQDRETMGMTALEFVQAIASSLNYSNLAGADHASQYPASSFVTHVVYFPHGQVEVDVSRLQAMGIKCIIATSTLRSKSGLPKFDEEAVRSALHQITH